MNNKNFILPFYFKGAPNPSVLMQLEIRVVGNRESDYYGLCRIYMDSHYNPILNEIDRINMARMITTEEAEQILKNFNCIQVKEGFDQYNIDDMKEIKDQLPVEWINGYNERESMF